MSALRRIVAKAAALLGRGRVERELDEELRFHFDQLVADGIAAGLDPAEARRQASIRLGGVEQVKEAHREQRGLPLLESLFADLRLAVRRLAHERGFATVAILTMAIGIGANSAIFSLVRGVLLEPLPYPRPDRLVRVFETSQSYPKFPVSPLNFVDYRRETQAFADLAAYTRGDLALSGDGGRPERLAALRVTSSYFEVLGSRPAIGRMFTEQEAAGHAKVVVLSDRVWRERFGADPAIAGRTVRLEGESWTVLGVMPPGFEHVGGDYRSTGQGATVDAWWPVDLDPERVNRGWHYLNVVGRMLPGTPRAVAEADLSAIAERLEKRYPDTNSDWRVTVTPLHREVVGRSRALLLVLTAAVGFVLLIACANVANLLLARATARRRELAMRSALGAGRGRLLRQSLTESAVLAAIGGGLGLGVAFAGVRALTALMPPDFPRLHAVEVDLAVLAFTAAVTAVTALGFGLAPAFRSRRADPRSALAAGNGRGGGDRGALRLRSLLVVAEVSLASALLIAAGLLLRSFATLHDTDPGFRPAGVLSFSVAFPQARYPDGAARARLVERLLERLAALPAAETTGAASYLPWSGWDENSGFEILDDPVERERSPHGRFGSASPDWFRTLGIPLVAGRFAADGDREGQPRVVVVNRSLADAYFPDGAAVGRRLRLWGEETEIVGVVGDVKDAPAADAAEPAFFWPYAQSSWERAVVAVRTAGDPLALLEPARAVLADLDPELPLAEVETLDAVATTALAERRFLLVLVALFAAVALALAAVGTYGVLAYSVQQRRRELGVRIALGADGRRIVALVLGQGLRLTASGLAIAVVLALLLGRLLESVLYGVAPTDPATFAAATATALGVAAAACWLPAARAARADPSTALRVE